MGRKALLALLCSLPLALGGCMSADNGEGVGGGGGYGATHASGYRGHDSAPPAVPGVMGQVVGAVTRK